MADLPGTNSGIPAKLCRVSAVLDKSVFSTNTIYPTLGMRAVANAREPGVREVQLAVLSPCVRVTRYYIGQNIFCCQCFASDSKKFKWLRRSAYEQPLWAMAGMDKVELRTEGLGTGLNTSASETGTGFGIAAGQRTRWPARPARQPQT